MPRSKPTRRGLATRIKNTRAAIIDITDRITDTFVDFLNGTPQGEEKVEPPRKRQKLSSDIEDSDHIIVHRQSVILKSPSSEISLQHGSIMRLDVAAEVTVEKTVGNLYRVEIRDLSQNYAPQVLNAVLEADEVPLDIEVARIVQTEARRSDDAEGHGRLWTVFDFELGRKEGSDYLQISWTIRWNITQSLDHISARSWKSVAIQRALDTYFPHHDTKQTLVEPWSPQDFYTSVHVPEKNDPISDSIRLPQLDTDLYPFQKRGLRWLLEREGVQWTNGSITQLDLSSSNELPYSFETRMDFDGQECYVSHLLKLVTKDIEPYRQAESSLRGGILAEEMGLGKTVEIIALISLHRRQKTLLTSVPDPYTMQNVRPSGATLIITPPSILRQWLTELNRHAPGLKVMHYEGIKAYGKISEASVLEKIENCDVVLTTYNVLASEIHYTLPPPDRQLRRESKYQRLKSPLVQLSWWRVCLDEAQMIESGVSNAATVARLIPRVNAWGVTGTPLKKDVADLRGLLIFLRLEPYASTIYFWSSLITSYRQSFKNLFKKLAMRHTKQLVRDELRLPPQQRFVITMPFTPVEEQYYQSLFQQMCDECGLDVNGAPISDDWDPDDLSVVEKMRNWLVRLRQSALHPEVGNRNRRALGNREGPLRTVDQVLEVMLEQSEISIRADQRNVFLSKLKRGQLLENSPRVKEALAIWTEVFADASAAVQDCRQQLQREIENSISDGNIGEKAKESDGSTDNEAVDDIEQSGSEVATRIGTFRNRLRAALEIEHMAVFFRANAYFQIKSNEDMTKPDSTEFKQLETLETEGYELAKKIRQEILKEIFRKNSKLMRKLSKKASSQSFVQIPEFTSNLPKGGIESRRMLEQLDILAASLDSQANQLDEWREKTIQLLLRPLVDEDEGVEITGDEYDESTKTQDEVQVYVEALRAVIEDRHDALTGQENLLIKGEVKLALRLAKEGEGAYPEKVIELLGIREKIKPTEQMGSMRAIISDLRALATSLRIDAENGSSRAQNELRIVEHQRLQIQKQFTEQVKAVTALRQEMDAFTALMNARLEYYRQLQQVSDMVAPFDKGPDPRLFLNMLAEEEKLLRKVATASAKRRYLLHLRNEASDPAQQRMCVICQSEFEIGALTVCGHQFCKECMEMWWAAHHNCPICKRKLIHNDLHDITYKPQELKVAEEHEDLNAQERSPTARSRKSAIYSEISKNTLSQIKNIELDGPSFTTKIDTLARHLMYLREVDPGAKSIIFSQFKDFLEVLGRALSTFRIGYSTIDRPGGVEKFKQDPGTECFLLHAKAHSSGLNLVNASHVFLCEPLINTAIELQAIARVDRIGQHQATNVYLYIIDGTVEESIYEISARRRLQHMGHTRKGKSKEATPELLDSNIEAANSLELQQAPLSDLLSKGKSGGEKVDKGDLWACLFGNVQNRSATNSEAVNREVARYLGAEAAESRRLIGSVESAVAE